jgi:protein gp37
MPAVTKIPWVVNSDRSRGASWNPWMGCEPVTLGCAECYAAKLAAATSSATTVFGDGAYELFDPAVPADWRHDAWSLVKDTPELQWVFATKRVHRARDLDRERQGTDCRLYVKQGGACPWDRGHPLRLRDAKGADPAAWPKDVRIRETPFFVPENDRLSS